MLQILQLVRMNGKLQRMDLHTLLIWCDLFVKHTATTLLSLLAVSRFFVICLFEFQEKQLLHIVMYLLDVDNF